MTVLRAAVRGHWAERSPAEAVAPHQPHRLPERPRRQVRHLLPGAGSTRRAGRVDLRQRRATTRPCWSARTARSRPLTEGGMVLGPVRGRRPTPRATAELRPRRHAARLLRRRHRDLRPRGRGVRRAAAWRDVAVARARPRTRAGAAGRRSCASWSASPPGHQGHRRPHPDRPQAATRAARTPRASLDPAPVAPGIYLGADRMTVIRQARATALTRPGAPPARDQPALRAPGGLRPRRPPARRASGAPAWTSTSAAASSWSWSRCPGSPPESLRVACRGPAARHHGRAARAAAAAGRRRLPVHGAAAGPLHARHRPRPGGGRPAGGGAAATAGCSTITIPRLQGPARARDRHPRASGRRGMMSRAER